MNAKLALKILAPYIAVAIFWCWLSNAWLAIFAYHAQILLWSRGSFSLRWGLIRNRALLLALPTVLAGPFLYVLLPYITRIDLSGWLAEHHLASLSLAAMIPYFGIFHPLLGAYHMNDLGSLLYECFRYSRSHRFFIGQTKDNILLIFYLKKVHIFF